MATLATGLRRHAPMQAATRERDGLVLAALCAASLLGTLNAYALGPFLPAIAADLGTTVPLLGQIATLMALLSAALGLVVGPLADRYGHRRALLAGLLAVLATGLGTALASTGAALLAAQLVGAFSGATLAGVSLAVAGTRFAGAARRRAMSWTVASLAGAWVAGVPLLTTVGAALGWRAAFLAQVALALGGLALVASALPPDAAPAAARADWRALGAGYVPLLRHRPTLALLAASGLRAACWFGALTYLGAFLLRGGLTTRQVGAAYLCGGVAYVLGSLAAGHGLARVAPRPLFAATTAAMGLLVGLLLALPVALVPTIAVLSAVFFTGAAGWVALTTLLAAETPAGQATTLVLSAAIRNLGLAGGGALGGLLLALGGYGALAVGLPLCALAAAVLAWRPHGLGAALAALLPAATTRLLQARRYATERG